VIEGGKKAITPAIVEESDCAAGYIAPPISQAGTGKVGTGPMPHCFAAGKMFTNHFPACTDPGKMTVGTQGKYATTRRTAIAFQINAGRKSKEIALDITMAPETIMPAAGTYTRPLPGIILAQSKNLLEENGNKIYHQETLLQGVIPPVVNGRGVRRKLSARSILKIKMASCEGQIIRQSLLSCQFILIISRHLQFKRMQVLTPRLSMAPRYPYID
jgi:hypothetical protein